MKKRMNRFLSLTLAAIMIVSCLAGLGITANAAVSNVTVSFSKNGGTGTMASQSVPENTIYTIPECTFTAPQNKVFDNWKIQIGAITPITVEPGDTIPLDTSITLVAQWKDAPLPIYTISFNPGAGTGTMASVTKTQGLKYDIPGCSFTAPSGKTFVCWSDGVRTYEEGEKITVSANLELTAVYDTIVDSSIITYYDMRTNFVPEWGTANKFPSFSSEKFVTTEAEWLNTSTYKQVSTLSKNQTYVLRLKFTANNGYVFEEARRESYLNALNITGWQSTIISIVSDNTFEAWINVKIPSSIKYNIYFDENGGTGTMNTVSVEKNSMYTLPSCRFTAPYGNKFDCWLVIWDEGGAAMTPGSSIYVTGDVFLIAQWTKGASSPVNNEDTNEIVDVTSKNANGKLYFSAEAASHGDRVIIEAVPSKGYEVDTVEVMDEYGREITVFPLGDNIFSFTMPAFYVFVNAEFKEAKPVCKKDKTCPLYKYTDLNLDGWYHDGIHYCVENGLMQGKSATRFDPDGDMTRAQILTVLWRYAKTPYVNYAMRYNDVKDGDWYAEAVRWASSIGIITGYENNEFRPNESMTREQLALVLYRYAVYMGVDVKSTSDENLRSYADYNEISTYALNAMQWVCGTGIITGSANKLRPADVVNRSQTAAIIVRFCDTTK